MFFAHITTSLYLLEHAIWAHSNREKEGNHELHAETFRRWVDEGGLLEAGRVVRAVTQANPERRRLNDELVYGVRTHFGIESKL